MHIMHLFEGGLARASLRQAARERTPSLCILYYAILYYTTLYCTMLCYAMLCSILYIYIYMYIFICMYVCMCIYIYIYSYIYIYIYRKQRYPYGQSGILRIRKVLSSLSLDFRDVLYGPRSSTP